MNFGPEGFVTFPAEPSMLLWAQAARRKGIAAATHPIGQKWWRHQQTWFVGVDALDNGADGAVSGVPLAGAAPMATGCTNWHAAQVSIIRPGYPRQDDNERDAAFAFRRDRDAAHLDGLLPVGPKRRRKMLEPHAFILGIALNTASAGASPLVVYVGSHRIMAQAFARAFAGLCDDQAADRDMTHAYGDARREVFATCPRVPVPLAVGEAVLLHPMMIHGIAPWAKGAKSDPEGRMIAYFRPPTSLSEWRTSPV
ncbi:MAG: phytanoyl-CoA dioxygenase family protein [Pseudomonadota bacterium]